MKTPIIDGKQTEIRNSADGFWIGTPGSEWWHLCGDRKWRDGNLSGHPEVQVYWPTEAAAREFAERWADGADHISDAGKMVADPLTVTLPVAKAERVLGGHEGRMVDVEGAGREGGGFIYDTQRSAKVPAANALEYMGDEDWLDDHGCIQTTLDWIEATRELRHACLAALGYIGGNSVLDEAGIKHLLSTTLKPFVTKARA